MMISGFFAHARKKSGFTLIEVSIASVVSLIVLAVVYKMFGSVQFQFGQGTVHLQNLQNARLAMSYLRRDLSSACLNLVGADGRQYVRELLLYPFQIKQESLGRQSSPILVSPHQLSFFRFHFQSSTDSSRPSLESVNYTFNPQNGTLIRKAGSNQMVIDGIQDVQFRLYAHKLNANVPLIWVAMKVHETDSPKGKILGKPLEITTSIGVPYTTDVLNFKNWSQDSLISP